MKRLRCEGPDCCLLTERAKMLHESDLHFGRCLCAEALAMLDQVGHAPRDRSRALSSGPNGTTPSSPPSSPRAGRFTGPAVPRAMQADRALAARPPHTGYATPE